MSSLPKKPTPTVPARPGSCGSIQFYDALVELELPAGVELLVEEPNHLFELKCRLNQDLSG